MFAYPLRQLLTDKYLTELCTKTTTFNRLNQRSSPLSISALQHTANKENEVSTATNNNNKETLKQLEHLIENPPTTCCMSGCSNCVWISYAEELTKLSGTGGEQAKDIIEKNVSDPSIKAFLLTEIRMRKL